MHKIVGQDKIVRELEAISQAKRPVNILLRGPAGCGKTTLALEFLKQTCARYTTQLPSCHNNKFILPQNAINVYGHFVDEIHTCSNIEVLYPLMDSNKYIFVFASNEYGELPDAFMSRCIVFTFEDYSIDDMALIVLQKAQYYNFVIGEDTALLIARNCKGSPRLADLYIKRMKYLVDAGYRNKSIKGIEAAFRDIGVYNGGYSDADIKYLRCLQQLGTASVNTISRIVGIDKCTIINDIEPFLIKNGHITITSKGRKFLSYAGNC